MGLVISVSGAEAQMMAMIKEQTSGICEDIVSNDGHLLLMPRAGKLMALLEILNEEGIAYHFQRSTLDEEL